MTFHPYLTFDGQCAEAFRFYEQCLGGKIETMMTYGESPFAPTTPAAEHARILHASMTVGEQAFAGADAPPGRYQKPQGMSVLLNLTDTSEAERIFQALSDGGAVHMPLQETFWAFRFGVVVDRFAIPWMLNCGRAE